MSRKIPFVESELKIVDELPGWFGGPGTQLRNTPVTSRENMLALFYEKSPFWMPTSHESVMVPSAIYNDNLGRGGGHDNTDAFGIEWEWVPAVKGSIVRPGEPLLKDVREWKDKIHFPDLNQYDWAAEAEKTKIDPRLSSEISLVNGFWFERLISFMDFAPAAMALIDEEQQDAVKELFQATTDFACKVVDKICETWPLLAAINIHDDWGAQKAPFFSEAIAYEYFVPFMRQLTGHIHSKGRYVTLHSCGHVDTRVQCFIDGGFDAWDPQVMNDIHGLYERWGDKIVLGVWPDQFDPEHTSEAEQRELARQFVAQYTQEGKPAILGHYGAWSLTPAFAEEVYIASRKRYSK